MKVITSSNNSRISNPIPKLLLVMVTVVKGTNKSETSKLCKNGNKNVNCV